MKNNIILILLYVITFILHYFYWIHNIDTSPTLLIKYYLLFSMMIVFILTIINIIIKISPNYLGFSFIGIIGIKFIIIGFIITKLKFDQVFNYKIQVFYSYVITLGIITYHTISKIKTDKKH